MGIDIGGAFTIAGVSGSQALKIAGAVDALTIDTTGRTFYPNQIGFIAGLNTDPGWIAQTGAAWTAQKYFNNTTYNVGGGYSAGRFTAPVAGAYLFHFTIYVDKLTAVVNNYSIPVFWINGANNSSGYRLRGYNQAVNYNYGLEIVDIIYLNAGDYVEVNTYQSAAGVQFYRYYSIFAGMLVG